MSWKKHALWATVGLAALVATGCGGSSGGSASNPNPLGTTPTTLGNTVYTDSVISDGEWIVWEGRKQNLMFYNGSTAIDLSGKLGPEYNLGTDNDNDWYGIGTDGRYVVFFADDVTDADPPQPFAIDTGRAGMPLVQIGELTDSSNLDRDSGTLADGILAWVMDDEAGDQQIFYYDFSDAVPALIQLTDDTDSKWNVAVSGTTIAWLQGDDVWYADLEDATPTPTQGTTSGNIQYLVAGDGIFAWIDGTDVVYVTDAGAPTLASDSTNDNSISALAVGNDVIAWYQNGQILYHSASEAAETVHIVANVGYTPYDLGVGDGFIAWSDGTDGFIYAVGDAADSEAPFATGIDGLEIHVAGGIIFYVEDLRNTGSVYPEDENPSAYLQVFNPGTGDPATFTTEPADDADYQRIISGDVANDTAAWFGHAANRTLYAKRASNLGAPVALTPPEMNAHNARMDGGIVAFQGLDRNNMDGANDGDDVEIYYCNLNAAGMPVIQVTNDDFKSENPRVGGNLIFWYDDTDTGYVSFYHNIASGVTTELTAKGTVTAGGETDGRYFVWYDYNDGMIHYYDTTDNSDTVVDAQGSVNFCPSFANGLVTWIAWDGADYTIFAIDFNDPDLDPTDLEASIIPVATAYDYDQKPETDGRYIVWGGDRNGDNDYPISYYDTAAETPVVVEIDADYIDYVCNPRFSNGLIVWAAVEYGADPSADGDREIFAFDLNAAVPEVVQLTDNALWDSQPELLDGVITWRTGGSSQWDWYGKVAAAMSY